MGKSEKIVARTWFFGKKCWEGGFWGCRQDGGYGSIRQNGRINGGMLVVLILGMFVLILGRLWLGFGKDIGIFGFLGSDGGARIYGVCNFEVCCGTTTYGNWRWFETGGEIVNCFTKG